MPRQSYDVPRRGHYPYVAGDRTDVVVINSYAGSLTLAATQHGSRVVASCEDAGYGLGVQRANFPFIDYHATRDVWPTASLAGKFVIAHPPCAAFSANTVGVQSRHGLEAPKFQQTRTVIDYALNLGCDALAVESVVGACRGAASVHEAAAARYGYHLYRVLQNAATFGVPQWRERFWAIFVRRGAFNNMDLRLEHLPVKVRLREVLEVEPTEFPVLLVKRWERQKAILRRHVGARATAAIVSGRYGYGSLSAVIRRFLLERGGSAPMQREVSCELCVDRRFLCQSPRLLDPDGLAPCVLHNSFFVVNDRPVSQLELIRIMGFTESYRWPPRYFKALRVFLSRGVCPPVARWVLETLERNYRWRQTYNSQGGRLRDSVCVLQPCEVADLRIKRALWDSLV